MSWLGNETFFLWQSNRQKRVDTETIELLLSGTSFELQNPDSGKIEIMINEPRVDVDSVDCDCRSSADEILNNQKYSSLTVCAWLASGVDLNLRIVYGDRDLLIFGYGGIDRSDIEFVQLCNAFEFAFYRAFAIGEALGLAIGSSRATYVDGTFYIDEWFRSGGPYQLQVPDLVIFPFPLATSIQSKYPDESAGSLGNGMTILQSASYLSAKIQRQTEQCDEPKSRSRRF